MTTCSVPGSGEGNAVFLEHVRVLTKCHHAMAKCEMELEW